MKGPPETKAALQASRDMLVTLCERVQKLIDEGKTEDEAVAAKPTKDLDPIWGQAGQLAYRRSRGAHAYQSLKGIKPPAAPPQAN